MTYTRRDVGKIALAAMPLARAYAAPNSKIDVVQIGVITYSFRGMNDPDEILKAIVKIGINSVELMSNHAEAAAGAPAQGGRGGSGGPGGAGDGHGRGPGGAPGAAPNGTQARHRADSLAADKAEVRARPRPDDARDAGSHAAARRGTAQVAHVGLHG